MPKPISTIRGAARPNSASRSTRVATVGNADAGHHLFVIALLGIRDPPLATHETADVPGATGSVHGLLASHAYEPIKPIVGEEGSAE
jgi:hypothetical protein